MDEGNGLAAEGVEAVPEGGKGLAMASVDESFVAGDHAADEVCGESINVERLAGLLGDGGGTRTGVVGGVDVEAEAEDEVADVVGVDPRLGEHAAGLAPVE